MRKARGRRAQTLRTTTSLVVVFTALAALHAKAQQQPSATARLWADEIHYQGNPQNFVAQGGVRMQVDREDGRVVLMTDHLDYDETQGLVRAQGGAFGKGQSKRWDKTQGALRLASGEVIFFQSLETDATLQPLRGEGLGWRFELGRHGGLSAATFQRRKRKKHKQDDWILRKVRYTRCPICADAQALREQSENDKAKDKAKDSPSDKDDKDAKDAKQARTFPPLWRIDASRMRWERFDNEPRGWFNEVPRIHLFHPRLNLYGVPIFYSPYLSFPANGARASGLLPPTYGLHSQRGAYLALPLYWAPHRSWDVTYLPIFTAEGKDASRFETRAAWGAGGKVGGRVGGKAEDKAGGGAEGASGVGQQATPSRAGHLFDTTLGLSLPHGPIGEGDQARFFAYGKVRWRAPWGLRADGIYHGLGDRRYLHDYGQGVSLLSTSAPEELTDRVRIEHFSRDGYARLTVEEERELLATPRADAWLLPELTYAHRGSFARSRKGGGSWEVEGLFRGAGQHFQEGIASSVGADIEEQAGLRQDIVSAAFTLGWRQNLPSSFVSQSALKLATAYWNDTEEGEHVFFVPEFQQSLEGLFAKSFKQGQRVFYLRPLLELYATLDESQGVLGDQSRHHLRRKLGGEAAFYETGARLGERLAFDSALNDGQRLLLATELGIRGARKSSAVLFVAPNLRRQEGDILSGRLWTGTRLSWRDRLLLNYDSTWSLPDTRWISQLAQIKAKTKGDGFALVLDYKEFRAFKNPSLYKQDLTLTGDMRLLKGLRLDLVAGYGFLGQSVPLGFSLTYGGSCVNLKFSYDRTIYSDREDNESFNVSLSFIFS